MYIHIYIKTNIYITIMAETQDCVSLKNMKFGIESLNKLTQ